jgi:predicted nuclease of predicted toxin-antitoxin system
MKLLLDECLPLDFRHSFSDHEVHTVQWAGFKGKKNGDLLRSAEDAGYHVFLTVDRGIPHQWRSDDRGLSIILIRSRTNQLEDLLPLVSAIAQVLAGIRSGQVIAVPVSE